jgi:hypothetical protein
MAEQTHSPTGSIADSGELEQELQKVLQRAHQIDDEEKAQVLQTLMTTARSGGFQAGQDDGKNRQEGPRR